MSVKYLHILALSTIVLLTCSYSTIPVAALSTEADVLHARDQAVECDLTTSATTPDASPSPPPSSGGSKKKKKKKKKAGLAVAIWDDSWQATMDNFRVLPKVSIFYNWAVKYQGTSNLTYAPMLSRRSAISQWNAAFVDGPDHPRYALGFNEPERSDQGDLDVDTAIRIWQASMMPLKKKGTILVSPAVSSAKEGATWMSGFFDNCPNCFDKLAVHWYGLRAEDFIKYLEAQHAKYNKTIWVTEFACTGFGDVKDCPNVDSFAQKVTAFMDNCSFVEHYFPFVIAKDLNGVDIANRLVDDKGNPTKLAGTYFGRKG